MNERQNSIDNASTTREPYSAPDYKRFSFETTDLIQKSGGVLNNMPDKTTANGVDW